MARPSILQSGLEPGPPLLLSSTRGHQKPRMEELGKEDVHAAVVQVLRHVNIAILVITH